MLTKKATKYVGGGGSEGPAYCAEHHLQEIQGIHPHSSDSPSDQSTQLGHLSNLDSPYRSGSQKTINSVQCRLYSKVVLLCWYYTDASF
jgi:hypothetical protein